jgi:DNA-directed RNA polymerase specialized sigma54-like protein
VVARVRVDDRALALELAAHLRDQGFLIAELGGGELRVDLLNHVSERYDRARVQAVVAEWTRLHPRGLSDDAVQIV